MMEGEEGRTARKKREARERIIAAAAELFMEKGARAVSMDEVAQAADVARRTLFNYFEGKDELLVATAGPVLEAAIELAEAAAANPTPSFEEVIELCLSLWRSCGRRLGLLYAVELEESPGLAELHARFLEILRRLIGKAASGDPAYASSARLVGKLVYRSFVPLLLALEEEEDAEERFARSLKGLLSGAAGPARGAGASGPSGALQPGRHPGGQPGGQPGGHPGR
ncbi:MAG: TetR/AcrR family transcriptional regulator [Spirochaetaceae bacterium]|nr:TetR/AcrR family transcriptional regulator [Spirochaetaceae bacterium]